MKGQIANSKEQIEIFLTETQRKTVTSDKSIKN